MDESKTDSNKKVFRTNSIHLRCTRDEYDKFQQAAREAGTSMNVLITSIADDERLLKELVSYVCQKQ